MASSYETILSDILDRLKAAPSSGWIAPAKVKRSHRTTVSREAAPQCHVVDGTDAPTKGPRRTSECTQREARFTVSIFVRADDGIATADAFKVEAYRRLNPTTANYGPGIVVRPGPITVEDEIADADAIRVDLDFELSYSVAGDEWTL